MSTETMPTQDTHQEAISDKLDELYGVYTKPADIAEKLLDWAEAVGDRSIKRALMYAGCLREAHRVQERHRPPTRTYQESEDGANGPGTNTSNASSTSKSHMALSTENLDWVIGGKRIEDLTREDLLGIADRIEAQAHGMLRRVRMFRHMASKMEPGEKVKDRWNERQRQRLSEEFMNED